MLGIYLIEQSLHSLLRELDTQAGEFESAEAGSIRGRTYKVAALAGTARARAGAKPGKKALKPPLP